MLNRSAQVSIDFDPERIWTDIESGVELGDMFREDELKEILGELGTESPQNLGPPDVSKADELQEKWGTAVGQIWVLGPHRLACGDCTDRTVVEAVMGRERAILVVTDPPYGVNYADKNRWLNTISKGNRIQTNIENDHEDKEAIQAMWKAAFKKTSEIMAAGAVIYCFMPQGGDQMMMMMMMMGAGIEPRQELIWIKNNHVLGRSDYNYKHEPILYAWKKGGHKFYGGFQTSVLEFDKPLKSDLHPTMKPIPLVSKLVENSSQLGELIYDPFLGSGTTMAAAHHLGRRCFGCELDPGYTAVCLQRMADMDLEPILIQPELIK
jgi:DNA modification methylase